MKDTTLVMAERLLQRKPTQDEMDRLSGASTIADVQQICNEILTREDRLSTADFVADYDRAKRMMIILPADDINLIIDVIEGRRVDAFVRGFFSGGFDIRPVSRVRSEECLPDSYRSEASLKIAFLQDMLESENVGLIEIGGAFEQAKYEYMKTIEDR